MKNNKIKKTVLALSLVAALGLGATLAYLTNVTETKTNVFSSSKSITTKLEEEFNPTEASSYTPGKVIHKKPTMTNESEDQAIYIAISLDYTNGKESMTYNDFKQYAEIINLNVTDYEKIGTDASGKELYMLKTTLAAGDVSPAIFTDVKVNAAIEEVKKEGTSGSIIYTKDADGNIIDVKDNTEYVNTNEYFYYDGDEKVTISEDEFKALSKTLPNFEILVKGFAVQATDVEPGVAKTELINLANATLGADFK